MLESCRLLPPQLPALMENRGWGKRRHLILNNSEGFVFCFWASHRSGLQKAIYFPNEITLACVLVWVQCSAVVCHLTSIFRLSPTLPPTAYETTGKLQQWLLQGKHNRQKSRPRSWTYNQALNQIFPSWYSHKLCWHLPSIRRYKKLPKAFPPPRFEASSLFTAFMLLVNLLKIKLAWISHQHFILVIQ